MYNYCPYVLIESNTSGWRRGGGVGPVFTESTPRVDVGVDGRAGERRLRMGSETNGPTNILAVSAEPWFTTTENGFGLRRQSMVIVVKLVSAQSFGDTYNGGASLQYIIYVDRWLGEAITVAWTEVSISASASIAIVSSCALQLAFCEKKRHIRVLSRQTPE